MKIEFLKSTPKRRAQIAYIKTLFTKAYAARERHDIPAYAQRLAEVDIALGDCLKPIPKSSPRSPWESSEITRRCRNLAELDRRAWSMAESLTLQEDRLRIGFEVEMTGGIPPEIGSWV